MLFAIARPVMLIGLLLAFLLALALRVAAMRVVARAAGLGPPGSLMLNPREDIDPFGAVCAAVAGVGWGRPVDIDAIPRWAGRGRRAAMVAVGPLVPLAVGVLVLIGYGLTFGEPVTTRIGFLLRGYEAPFGIAAQFVLGLGAGLLGFGLFNLIPLPPLDGFNLLWLSMRNISPGGHRARQWMVEKNVGVVALLVMAFFPFSYPFLFLFVDLIAAPFLWALA